MKIHARKYLLLPLLCASTVLAQSAPPKPKSAPTKPNAKAKPKAAPKSAPKHADGDGHDHAGEQRVTRRKGESEVDFFWRKSDEAFHDGDYERAIQWHRAIVAKDPHDIRSWSVASWLMWSLGRGGDATAWIDKGLKANACDWEMWDEAAQQAELQKQAPRALAAYQRALKLLPKDADKQQTQLLRRRLAHAAERGGDMALSVQTWRDLVRDYPAEVVNKNNLARVEASAKN